MRTPSALVAERIHRRYVDKTLVLATEFETPGGRLTLTDALAVGPNELAVSSAPRPGAMARRRPGEAVIIEGARRCSASAAVRGEHRGQRGAPRVRRTAGGEGDSRGAAAGGGSPALDRGPRRAGHAPSLRTRAI